jgi:hypothetical protein
MSCASIVRAGRGCVREQFQLRAFGAERADGVERRQAQLDRFVEESHGRLAPGGSAFGTVEVNIRLARCGELHVHRLIVQREGGRQSLRARQNDSRIALILACFDSQLQRGFGDIGRCAGRQRRLQQALRTTTLKQIGRHQPQPRVTARSSQGIRQLHVKMCQLGGPPLQPPLLQLRILQNLLRPQWIIVRRLDGGVGQQRLAKAGHRQAIEAPGHIGQQRITVGT